MDIDAEENVRLLDDEDSKDVHKNDKCTGEQATNEHYERREYVGVDDHDNASAGKDNGDNDDKIGMANGHLANGTIPPSTERRSDEPAELSFEKGKWRSYAVADFSNCRYMFLFIRFCVNCELLHYFEIQLYILAVSVKMNIL